MTSRKLGNYIANMNFNDDSLQGNNEKIISSKYSYSKNISSFTPKITIFTVPRAFKGHIGRIQENAIKSWSALKPSCEIILLGEEEGTEEAAKKYSLVHIPEIKKNKYGTPLLNSAFSKAQEQTENQILTYINADIILLKDFMQAIKKIVDSELKNFFMIGERINVPFTENLSTNNPNWENEIYQKIQQEGVSFEEIGIDYFVFNKNAFPDFPSFTVGRPVWDQWFVWKALEKNLAVIDASGFVTAVHQNHDYTHVTDNGKGVKHSPEADMNLKVAGGRLNRRHIGHANFIIREGEIAPKFLPDSELEKCKKIINENSINSGSVDLLNLESNYQILFQERIIIEGNKFYTQKDYTTAFRYYSTAAQRGNVDAMFNTVYMYINGQAPVNNYKEANYWLKKIAKYNYLTGTNLLAIMFDSSKRYFTKNSHINFWEKRAQTKSDKNALLILFIIYLYGYATQRNLNKGFYFLEKLLQNNDSRPLILLSCLIQEDSFSKKENTYIYDFCIKYQESELPEIYLILALLHLGVKGIKKDSSLAEKYCLKEMDLGKDRGINILGLNYFHGINMESNRDKAFQLLNKGARRGFPKSLNNLGYIYEREEKLKKAYSCYVLAAEKGNVYGMFNTGKLIKDNPSFFYYEQKKGDEFLKKVSKKGFTPAEKTLFHPKEEIKK